MKFYAGRFSLLPANQNMFYRLGSEQKFEYVLDALKQEAEFESKGISILLEPLLDKYGNVVGGKIGKQALKSLPIKDEGKMVKRPEVLYPHVSYILIPNEQIILVQRDRTVFSSDLQVFHYFEQYFEQKLLYQGLEVEIKPLIVKGTFWETINSAEKIYSVRFSLAMPNFLGSTETELRDTLNLIKGDTNSNKVDFSVSNKKGELQINSNGMVRPMVNWAENGAGEWNIRRKLKGRKKISTITSSDQIATFECSSEFDTTTAETIQLIREQIDIEPYKTQK